MNLLTTLLLVTLADAPQLEITTLTGKTVTGSLNTADQSTWVLTGESGTIELPAAQVLEARVRVSDDQPEASSPHAVILRDGSCLSIDQVVIKGDAVQVSSALLGDLALPRTALSDVRLAESPSAVDADWIEMIAKERRQDMLVVQKEDKLDFVEGVIGDITAEQISFLLNGQNVPVPRDRVFGLLFRQADEDKTRPAGLIETTKGDSLTFKKLTSDGTGLSLTLTSGPEITVPLAATRRIDFSFGKLMWLSALKPRVVKHEWVWIDLYRLSGRVEDIYENDGAINSPNPLSLNDQTYSRGVCIRSRTLLRYRLDGDYSRFQALMGIQDGRPGLVRVEISLDGQKIFEQTVAAKADKPVPIDLDVSDKFVLDVLVDYGEAESDIGDHLVLANARLLR
jgi:hypothetical protein